MNMLISNAEANSVSPDVGNLALCLTHPGSPEKTFPLPLGKCTVGSSARCMIHLSSPQVRPLHCLIVHGAHETVVTRWAPGVLLNGQSFTTATFQAGDCLQIGEAELRLVALKPQPEQPKPRAQDEPSFAKEEKTGTPPKNLFPVETSCSSEKLLQKTASNSSSLAASCLESDRLVRQLWSANYRARQRCRGLVGTLRDLRTEAGGFDQQIDSLQEQLRRALGEREQISGEVDRLRADSTRREAQVTQEMDRLISELSSAYEKSSVVDATEAQHAQQYEQLRLEIAALSAEREQLLANRTQDHQHREELERSLADRVHHLGQLEKELQQALAVIESTREQVATSDQLLNEVEALRIERESLQATILEFQQHQPEWEVAVAERDQRIGELLREMEQTHREILSAEERSAEQGVSCQELQEALQQLEGEREQLVVLRNESQENQKQWDQTLAERDHRIGELQAELEQVRVAVELAQRGREEQTAHGQQLQAELEQLREEHGQLVATQSEHQQRQEQWEEAISERDCRFEKLQAEHQQICETLQTFEQGAFDQIDACKRLEEELAKVQKERDQLIAGQPEREQQLRDLEQAQQAREQQIVELSEELAKLGQSRAELEVELVERRSASQQRETEATELRSRCEDLSTKNDSYEQREQELQQALVGQQDDVEELRRELEVAHQQSEELASTVAERTATWGNLEREHAELSARCEQLATDSEAESTRCQQLEAEIAERQQSTDLYQADLQAVRAELERSVERTNQLDQKCRETESQIAALHEERDQFVATLETAQQELETLRLQASNTSEEADAIAQPIATLEEEKALLAQQLEEQGQLAAQWSNELESVQSELAAEQSQMEQLDQRYQQTQRELLETRDCLLAAEKALQQQPTIEAAPSEVTSEADIAPEPDTETPAEEDNTTEDAIAHLQELSVWSEKEATPDDAQAMVPPPEEVPAKEFTPPTSFIDQYSETLKEDENELPAQNSQPLPVVPTAEPEISRLGDESDEDALEAYMANMMRRVRGDSVPEELSALLPSLAQVADPVAEVDAAADPAPSTYPEPVELALEKPLDLSSLKRSSQKHALPTNLAAMRELANSSARGAIAKHHKRRYMETALSKLVLCVAATGAAGYILLTAENFLSVRSFGGWVACAVGVTSGFRLFGELLEAIRSGAPAHTAPAEIPVDEVPLPIAGVES